MADSDNERRALVVAPDRTPAPLANLAARTLIAIEAIRMAESRSARSMRQVLPGPFWLFNEGLSDWETTYSRFPAERQLLIVGFGGYESIGAAVAAARDGERILVRSGEYRESVVVRAAVAIIGANPRGSAVIQGVGGPAFVLERTSAALANLTVSGEREGAHAGSSAVLVVGGSPTLRNLRVLSHPGIEIVEDGTPKIFNCESVDP